MKKAVLLFSFILLLFILAGCTGRPADKNGNNDATNTNNGTDVSTDTDISTDTSKDAGTDTENSDSDTGSNEDSAPQDLSVKDYFPIRENVKYEYEGSGNEYASYTMQIDYTSKDRVQQRIDNGGTVTVKVIEVKDGKVTRLLSKGETYHRENLLKVKGEEEVLLMEPLKKGTTWKLADSRTRTINDVSASVTTPSGSYDAIEVVTEGDKDKTIDYYAKDVGLVKSVFISGDTEISSSLSKIEENVPLVQTIRFYYPNINDEIIYYKEKEVTFQTNDITKVVLASVYKEGVDANLGKVFSDHTQINSLYLNKDGMVYIDLNQAFLTEMNAGSGYEAMILQCIANTFGNYYNAEKMILTIDNKLYESGHIAMQKGQYLKVNNDNTVAVK